MRRLILLFVTFTYLYTMGQVNEQTSAGFEFPFKIGDAQWKSYPSVKERVAALQIPNDKLKSIKTADLLNLCLEFPYSTDIFAFDSPEIGFKAICNKFNGYQELLTRNDLAESMLAKCASIPDEIDSIVNKDKITQGNYSFKCYILFYMMGLDTITSTLNSEKSEKIYSTIRKATEKMKKYPDIFGISYGMGIKTIASDENRPDGYETKIKTPNGYEVTVDILTEEDLSQSEKEKFKRELEAEYPNVVFLSEATNKYNCHAYAWYIQSLPINGYVYLPSDKLVWMEEPSIYWLGGCYYEVAENDATIVFYSGDHSAIRINSNEYISKWGNRPLVKHSPNDVLDIYGAPKSYYKLYQPQITGPDSISTSATYTIDPLPTGFTVIWSLSDPYYAQNHMTVDANGRCTITRDSHQSLENAILTATIRHDKYIAQTLTKTINASTSYNGFIAFYNWSDNNVRKLEYPYIIYMNKSQSGSGLNINSTYFVGATITYEGDIIPTRWVVDNYNGNVSVRFPTTTNAQAFVINVNCKNGDFYRITVINQARAYNLSADLDGEILDVALIDKNSGIPLQNNMLMNCQETESELEWILEIYDTATNQKIYSGKVTGSKVSVDTSDWKPGIYVIHAIVGENTFSKKIIIK